MLSIRLSTLPPGVMAVVATAEEAPAVGFARVGVVSALHGTAMVAMTLRAGSVLAAGLNAWGGVQPASVTASAAIASVSATRLIVRITPPEDALAPGRRASVRVDASW